MSRGRNSPLGAGPLLLALACAAYVLVFWRRLLIEGRVPIDGDMMRLVYPTWSIGNRLFSGALVPLWDSYRNMGCPFLAHPPNQVLYPLHRLFSVASFVDYLRLYVVAHVLLAAVPSYLLARRWGMSAAAGLLAALAVSCNGFVVARVTTTIDFASYAWAPLALYALSCRRPIALALTLACQWFAGFPTFCLMTGLLLWVAAAADDDPRSAIRTLMIGGVVGAALAAVQVAPFLELMSRSSRPVLLSADAAAQFALHPKELLRPLAIPSYFLNQMKPVTNSDPAVIGFYLGPVLAALAIAGAALGGRRERVFAGATLACLALTLGPRIPFYSRLPFITVFRFPAHWLYPAVILTSLLAASAVDRLRRPGWPAAAVALVAVDLLVYAWPVHVAWAEPAVLDEKPQQLSLLGPAIPPGRVFFEPALINLSSQWAVPSAEDWTNLVSIGLPSIGAGYGLREVASRHQLPIDTQVAFIRRLSALPPDHPSFDYAGVSTIVRLTRLVPGVPPPSAFEITSNPDAKAEAFFPSGGRVVLIQGKGDNITVETEGPGELVLSESYDRGWVAIIDGKKAPTAVFDEAFPSVAVPAGTHVVRFRYRPRAYVVGLLISCHVLGLLVLGFVRRRWRLFVPKRFHRRKMRGL